MKRSEIHVQGFGKLVEASRKSLSSGTRLKNTLEDEPGRFPLQGTMFLKTSTSPRIV